MSAIAPRIMIAKPGLDGHDRGAVVVVQGLRDAGFDVIYTGLRRSAHEIAIAAAQEDVDVLGLSILSGAHDTVLPAMIKELNALDWRPTQLMAGGIIPDADAAGLKQLGFDLVFGPGTSLHGIAMAIRDAVPARTTRQSSSTDWVKRAQVLTDMELTGFVDTKPRRGDQHGRVAVLVGAGGAGKSTLIGGLLRSAGKARIAVIANDPSGIGKKGSVLADRLRMPMDLPPGQFLIRSLPVIDDGVGLSQGVGAMATMLAQEFDLVLVETIGVGQNQAPDLEWVDELIAVVAPGMGDHWQMRKTAYLEIADKIVITKSDLESATQTEADLRLVLHDTDRSTIAVHAVTQSSGHGNLLASMMST